MPPECAAPRPRSSPGARGAAPTRRGLYRPARRARAAASQAARASVTIRVNAGP